MTNKIMAYIRKKRIKGYTYYYVVEGYYSNKNKLKQRVVRYLGSVENILKKFEFWEKHQ
jgi:hypothetical protein